MGRNECVRGILKGADDLSDEEIAAVVDELERRRGNRRAKGDIGDDSRATMKDAEDIAADLELAAQIEKRNAKLNQLIYRQLGDDIGNFGNDAYGLEAMIAGTNKRVKSGRYSVDALRRAREGKYLGGLVHDLRQAKLLDYVVPRFLGVGKGLLDDKIAIELWERREGGRPGSTGSKEAKGVADIIYKYQELARTDQNLHGAFIKKLDGYIVSQSHDMFRIAKAGKDAWVNFIQPLLDDRTFENVKGGDAGIREFLGKVYNELSTGAFYKVDTDAPLIGFKGPANLAKKVSQSRVLHFADAQSWIKYNDNFGKASLMEAVAGGLRHAANTTALLERFGPNPKAMFQRVLGDLRQKAIDGPKDVRDRLHGQWPQRLMDVADGTVDIPANVSLAHISSGIRAAQTMAKLGGAVLSSIPDIATAASELRYQGHNFLGAMGETFGGMLAQIGDGGQRREAAELIGVGIDSVLRDISARFTGADNAGRSLNKLTTAFFKLNLLEQWTNAAERSTSTIMSRDLAMRSGLKFEQLPDRLKTVLGQYGITAEDWKYIRHATATIGDTDYIAPEMLREVPGLNARQIDALETKVRAYFADRSHIAVLQGGIREKAYTTQGLQAGTGMGEAIRFMMQFKTYSISFVQKFLGRYTQEDHFWSIPGSAFKMPRSEAAQLAGLIVTLTGLGYLSMVAKDLAKGKTPRDPRDPKTMISAMAQGGGAGIYGDFLFGQANREGGGPLETAIGPFFGNVSAAADIALKARDYATGQSDAPDTEIWNLFKNNTPFINLFYTRAALDYLVLYQIQESMNPGSLKRMEQRLKHDQHQQFLLPPSQVVHH